MIKNPVKGFLFTKFKKADSTIVYLHPYMITVVLSALIIKGKILGLKLT
jgi:hypothetical protein